MSASQTLWNHSDSTIEMRTQPANPRSNYSSHAEEIANGYELIFISKDQQADRMNPKVDTYLGKVKKWKKEIEKLRDIILGCHLTEEFKWNKPCYTFQGSNVVLILPLKQHCALLFFKGALLHDASGILTKPGENTQAGRQLRLISLQQIIEMESTLKAYIYEAVEVEKAGLKVIPKKNTNPTILEELQDEFDKNPSLKSAFYALTPGRQRAYNIYFSAPKQSKTRTSRIEKCTQQILEGKGLNDDYMRREK